MPKVLFLLVVFLTACLPSPPPLTLYNWSYSDLITLDPADNARPELDLIAFYQRADRREVQFRLDFLDLNLQPTFDLYLALDLKPGGARALPIETTSALDWDALVVIPASGQPVILNPDMRPRADLIPRVVRDPGLDMVVISLVQPVLDADPDTLQVEIYLAPAGEKILSDEITLPETTGPGPLRAPVLLAFWNTFPAYSPAQALRRWDGAHTGPFGERHGLSHLINGIAAYKVPVTLLDIKSPLALSALDFLGKLPAIRSLSAAGLLTLPDVIPLPHQASSGDLPFVPPAPALVQGAAMSRAASAAFGLPSSQLLYAPLAADGLPGDYDVIYLPSAENSRLARWGKRVVVPLPAAADPLQATPDGLALPIRKMLLDLAITGSSQPSLAEMPFVFLGGDLTASAWGDPQASRAALRYITEHPWIWPLTERDLLTARPSTQTTPPPPPFLPETVPETLTGEPTPNGLSTDQVQIALLNVLDRTPPGPARDLAWTAYFALLAPNPPPGGELGALRRGYLGQVGAILAAAHWAADPVPFLDCEADPDFDGQPECILANESVFTIFESQGARLTFGFIQTPEGPVQWIGPLSQFLVGLSDPSEWEPTRGPAGDPADVPGAFSVTRARWTPYNVATTPGSLSFSTPAVGMTKTFTLTPTGIHAAIRSQGTDQYTVQIPFALSPETRFTPGWGEQYQAAVLSDGFTWQAGAETRARLTTTGSASLVTFVDSLSYLGVPEDPNFDFPPGHLVPFPLAIGEISTQGDLEIQIQVWGR